MRQQSGCLGLFGLIWLAFLMVFDYLGFGPLAKQFTTTHFRAAPAVVLSSEVEVRDDGSSTSYHPSIRYRYTVDGKTLEGQRYRYFNMSNRKNAYQVVKSYPAGKATQAFYNPKDAGEAVLARGIEPGDCFFAMFLIPFHVVGLGLLVAAWPARRLEAGFPLSKRLTVYYIKTHYTRPLFAGFATLGCFSFALIFVNGFLLKMNLSWTVIAGEMALLAMLSIQAALTQARNNSDLSLALTLDQRSQTLAYREQRWELSRIEKIEVEEIDSGDSDRANDYWLRLHLEDGTSERVVKAQREPLEQLANWLTKKL